MKKIAFVGNELWDMYNFRGEVIQSFVKKGYDVSVITLKDEKNEYLIEKLGAKYIEIEFSRKGKKPIKDLKLILDFRKIYLKEKFDLVFHYTIKPNIYGTLATRLTKTRSIAITTGLGYAFINDNLTSRLIKQLYKFSLKFSEEVWFLNKDDEKVFIENKIIKKEKVFILPGEGINLEKFIPLKRERNNDKVIFLMIARALWDKGFKEYVEAAEITKKKYKNVEFQLLGVIDKGNPSGVPEEEVMKYHDENIINYLGVTNDVPKVIKECNCVILPSYREGMPRTLMEAAAMEKAIIATDVEGCKEVIDDGINGYLCRIKDGVDLAKKIEKFINLSLEEKINMGKKGRTKMSKEMDVKLIIDIYLEKIKKLKV